MTRDGGRLHSWAAMLKSKAPHPLGRVLLVLITILASASAVDKKCMESGGITRCWLVHVGSAAPTSKSPLVVILHGYTATASREFLRDGWAGKADSEGFIAVWAEGTSQLEEANDPFTSWNAGGGCCGGSDEKGIDDVAFLKAVVACSLSDGRVDPARVYLGGHSNGCAMAQRLAVEAPQMVAGVGCVAWYLLGQPKDLTIAEPVPLMEIHGTTDRVIPYEESNVAGKIQSPGALENAARWAGLNGCGGAANVTQVAATSSALGYQVHKYSPCSGGAEVQLVTIEEGNHSPMGDDQVVPSPADWAWGFVSRFSKPGGGAGSPRRPGSARP